MPIKQSAKKALRQAKKKTARNLEIKKAYKEAVKNVKKSIINNDKDLKEKMRLAQKNLAKAAKKGVIKKNTAARKISRMTKAVNKVAKK